MPWPTDPAAKRAAAAPYQDPQYKANRALARRRANGRCEGCQHRHGRLQCDHITALSQGGTHALANLQMVCAGPGTCRCHERKTAQEGGGYRSPAAPQDPEPLRRTAW